jgi:DNA polymerase-3 subunit gamma/tau
MTLLRMLAFAPENAARRPATPAPAMPSSAGSGSKKKMVDVNWNTLIAGLPLSGMERMLAHHSELIAWRDGHIELRIPQTQRHLAERPYQERLKTVLEAHLGAKVRLEISVGTATGNTIAELQERDSKQRQSAAAAAIDDDPFIRDLIQHFDARVVASSVKPNNDGEHE